MSVSAQSRATAAGTGSRATTMFYQPKARILVVEFPRRGAYLYQNVPARAYEILRQSPVVRASFIIEGRHRHYSVVAAS